MSKGGQIIIVMWSIETNSGLTWTGLETDIRMRQLMLYSVMQ